MAKQNQTNALWAKITDTASAEAAVKTASNAAALVAGVTALVGGIALVNGPVLGVDGSALADAVVMAVAAWRIRHQSRAWSVVALLDWLVSLYGKLASANPAMSGALLASIGMLLLFVGGVRGTFALARYRRTPAAVATA